MARFWVVVAGVVAAGGPAVAQLAVVSQSVAVPAQGGGSLAGVIYAPTGGSGTFPVISMLPGGGQQITSADWAASRLAASGYVVLLTQPSSGISIPAYNTAARSGIDFLQSAANPFADRSRTDRVGAAGWSLGGRTLARTQEEDARLGAIVAWDHLAKSEFGDQGTPLGPVVPTSTRTPRVPALGLASDTNPNQSTDPLAKLDAYGHWKAAGVPTAGLVMKDANHFFWSGGGSNPRNYDISNHYTAAWFDRWLKDDPTGIDRLLAPTVNGEPVGQVLSGRFVSAVFADGREVNPVVPVPEPAAVLLAAGLGLAAVIRRRRRATL